MSNQYRSYTNNIIDTHTTGGFFSEHFFSAMILFSIPHHDVRSHDVGRPPLSSNHRSACPVAERDQDPPAIPAASRIDCAFARSALPSSAAGDSGARPPLC